jgi:tRNA threonylcarbamoyladenosine biosynthesis protein TsaE
METPGIVRFTSRSRVATHMAGRALGLLLQSGDTVAMDGDLGAGKTTLTAGIAEGVGCLGPVSSPTFVLAMEHPAGQRGLALHHMDLYRLNDAREFLDTGLDEDFASGVSVVEWARIAGDFLPPDRIVVILQIEDENSRQMEIVFGGPGGAERADRLAAALSCIQGIEPVNEASAGSQTA